MARYHQHRSDRPDASQPALEDRMAAAPRDPRPAGYHDRGERQARAFAAVLNRWNPLQRQGSHKWRPLSNSTVAGRITARLGRQYWPNDVQRAYDGDARPWHLQPEVVQAYCEALERTDPASMAEAFHAIEQKPPEVTQAALQLAIATSRGGSGRLSA
jgi:hypothetical protein